MTLLQHKIWNTGAAAALIALTFAPICWMNDSDSCRVNFHFWLSIPQREWDMFVWPVTIVLIVLELLGILVITATASWLAGRFSHRMARV